MLILMGWCQHNYLLWWVYCTQTNKTMLNRISWTLLGEQFSPPTDKAKYFQKTQNCGIEFFYILLPLGGSRWKGSKLCHTKGISSAWFTASACQTKIPWDCGGITGFGQKTKSFSPFLEPSLPMLSTKHKWQKYMCNEKSWPKNRNFNTWRIFLWNENKVKRKLSY